MRDEFSTFDISKALGIPKGRLREWIINDWVKPTIPADGPGTRAVFTRNDVYAVELFKQLVDLGLKRANTWYVLNFMKDYPSIDLKDGRGPLPVKWTGVIAYFKNNKVRGFVAYNRQKMFSMDAYDRKLEDESDLLLFGRNLSQKVFKNPGTVLSYILEDEQTEKWDQILILNFEKVRRKVDMALSGLE